MSRAEKSRTAWKPTKLPSSVFEFWEETFASANIQTKGPTENAALKAAQDLISARDLSWDDQATRIKKLAKATQALSKSETPPFKLSSTIEIIASSGYFAATENLSRRHFIPLIEAASKHVEATFFGQLYKQYIVFGSDNALFRDQSLAQKALTIHATLDFDAGRLATQHLLEDTLHYLIECLEQSQNNVTRLLAEASPDVQSSDRRLAKMSAAHSLTVDKIMSDIQYVTKSILVILSRSPGPMPRLFAELAGSESSNGSHEHATKWTRLFSILFNLCADTSTYLKDCSQAAGMTIAALISGAKDTSFARDLVLGWFFTESSCLPEATKLTSTIWNITPNPVLSSNAGWDSRDPPMLSVVRGLVSNLRKDILTAPLPADLMYRDVLPSQVRYSCLNQILFASIAYFCSKADLEPQSKVIAFESMAMWLMENKSMINAGKSPQTMDTLSTILQPDNVNLLVHYVWDHWDDPIDSIQHKVRAIFELLLDILERRAEYYQDQKSNQEFLLDILDKLMAMDWHRKVKYALLNITVPKLGTDAFLKREPDFVWKCLQAMDSLVLSPQIAALVLTFLYRRVEETVPGYKSFNARNSKLIENQDTKIPLEQWNDLWMIPVLRALTSNIELVRRNASGFILQPLFKISPSSFWRLMDIVRNPDSSAWERLDKHYYLHAFVAVLKAGRSLDIVDANAYTLQPTTDPHLISVDTLRSAVYHVDSQVRIDVLGLICESRKATALVTKTELDLLQFFLPANMNCTLPEFRQRMCTHITKFLQRLRGNLYAEFRTYKSLTAFIEKNIGKRPESDMAKARSEAAEIMQNMENAKSFLYWLNDHIATSLYPGASYQRVATALRLFAVFVKIFGVDETPIPEGFANQPEFPFKLLIASARNTKILINVLMNPYDFNRNQAFDILIQFPSPLPEIQSKQEVQELLWWGLSNVVSTRASESDSGAMIFRLVFRKYVMELGLDITPERDIKPVEVSKDCAVRGAAPVVFVSRLLDLLDRQVSAAKSNLLLAAQRHPMHGTLLALQYAFTEIDYAHPLIRNQEVAWRELHQRALSVVNSVSDAVMDVLSNPSPEGNVPASFREMEEAVDDLIEELGEAEGDDESSGLKHQVILSCCWRAIKEASALLQVIISNAPVSHARDEGMITYSDMIACGTLLRTLLTTIRHRGAFSAVYPAYVSLNTRLLSSSDPSVTSLPMEWLQDNLSSLTSTSISVTRRSAGLPLCILAIVSSEQSTKMKLLDMTIQRLLELAEMELSNDANERIDLPQVHAYNILRTIFMDSKLATHVQEHASRGFALAINGFSSPSWAIRNCSVMLFSTLLQRTFGTKKTKDEHSAVNKLTGREFFTRYPQLYPYLLKELAIAVDQLLTNVSTANVHPGLYPILTLLSRMYPSVMDGSDTAITMAAFIPLVKSCAKSAIFKTREMAARALAPLVPSANLGEMILDILEFPDGITQNEAHGRFLQTQFLLRAHLYNPGLNALMMDNVKILPFAMLQMLDKMRSRQFCAISFSLFLDILAECFFACTWLAVEDDTEKDLKKKDSLKAFSEYLMPFRITVAEYCWAQMELPANNTDIGTYLVRKSMANILMISVLEGYINKSLDDILFLLDDPDYEVRLVVMDQLKKHMENNWDRSQLPRSDVLQRKLVIMTSGHEPNLSCFVTAANVLALLWSISPQDILNVKCMCIRNYWASLLKQCDRRSQAIIESVLPLLGALLSKIIAEKDVEWVTGCFEVWQRYISSFSKQEAALPLRESTVNSLQFMMNHLLDKNVSSRSYKNLALLLQFDVAQLLQDDDVDIRENVAEMVSTALHLTIPVHPERGVELIYMGISQYNRHDVQEHFKKLLCGHDKWEDILRHETAATKTLFAKESPNIYKENLVDVQWAYSSIRFLQHKQDWKQIDLSAVKKCVTDTRDLLTSLKKCASEMTFCGPYGITMQPLTFLMVYRLVLMAISAISSLEHSEQLSGPTLSDITKLEKTVEGFAAVSVHPLVAQLLFDVDGLLASIAHLLNKYRPSTCKHMFLLSQSH